MTLTKTDLNDIKKLMVETIGPMFEEQNMKIDALEKKFDILDRRTEDMQGAIEEIKIRLLDHDHKLEEIQATCKRLESKVLGTESDIADILDRINQLEKRFPNASETDIKELKHNFKKLAAWAKLISAKTGIPLEAK